MKLVKCIYCGNSDSVDEIINDDNKVVYRCYSCGRSSSQAISLDSRLKLELSKTGELQHQSIGILVRNRKKQVLMVKRRFFPFSWAIVFGHVHNGENFESAAKRELIEETGIKAEKLKSVYEEVINAGCRTNVRLHHVKIFETIVDDDTFIVPNSESEFVIWVDLKEIGKVYKPVGDSTRKILERLHLAKIHAPKK
ncbi:MAG TPA: NUDIX hydrolase [Flavobacterium sp.]|nr:NUDIX hydrolase [Flavobacterium sp.]